MIEFKKSELEGALITIAAYDSTNGTLVSGLLKEDITLGTKRKLQKIHKKLHAEYRDFINDIKEIQKLHAENEEQRNKELEILYNEVVKIDAEKASLEIIENVKTTFNYSFDLIEKMAA